MMPMVQGNHYVKELCARHVPEVNIQYHPLLSWFTVSQKEPPHPKTTASGGEACHKTSSAHNTLNTLEFLLHSHFINK